MYRPLAQRWGVGGEMLVVYSFDTVSINRHLRDVQCLFIVCRFLLRSVFHHTYPPLPYLNLLIGLATVFLDDLETSIHYFSLCFLAMISKLCLLTCFGLCPCVLNDFIYLFYFIFLLYLVFGFVCKEN